MASSFVNTSPTRLSLSSSTSSRCSSGRRGMPTVQDYLPSHQSQISRGSRSPVSPASPSTSSSPTGLQSRRSPRRSLQVNALDAAQPFDFEAQMQAKIAAEKRLRIGIVGFGTFGQFLARRMVQYGHEVLATSRTPYHEEAAKLGVQFFTDIDDFCEEHPEVVILSSSILSTEKVLRSLPLQRLKRNTLFVDVLSVKVFPKQLFLSVLPPEMDILCTHPMFGPDSGKGSWTGLNFMYEKVRIGRDRRRQARCESLLKFFQGEGCTMVDMTCEEHDRQAASTQFITHTVGRVLGAMHLESTDINTRGFDSLLNLVNNTANDSFELYYGLFLYNKNATEELERLEQAFDHVKKQLLGRLHDIAREQLFPVIPEPADPSTPPSSPLSSKQQQLPAAPSPLLLPAHSSELSPPTAQPMVTMALPESPTATSSRKSNGIGNGVATSS